MTSFVAEVLASAGSLGKEDLRERLDKLTKRVDKIKNDVYDSLHCQYTTFKTNLNKTLLLYTKATNLSHEIDALNERIQNEILGNIRGSTTELQDLQTQLQKCYAVVNVLKTLYMIHKSLESLRDAIGAKDIDAAVNKINFTQTEISKLMSGGTCELKILNSLKVELLAQKAALLCALNDVWQDSIKWHLKSREISSRAEFLTVKLDLVKHVDKKQNFHHTIQALHNVDELSLKIAFLNKNVYNVLLKPLVQYHDVRACIVDISEDMQQLQFVEPATQKKGKKKSQQASTTPPSSLFHNVHTVLHFLHQHLYSIELSHSGSVKSLMQLLGEDISDELCDNIIRYSLMKSIPATVKELQDYVKVNKQIVEFEKSLHSMGFLSQDKQPFLSYTENIEVHFSEKKCRMLLGNARELMKSPLHNTVKLRNTPTETEESESDVQPEDQNHLSEATFKFPDCSVSKATSDVVQLAHDTLEEACSSNEQCGCQLFYTVREIFDMFLAVVPIYHKDSLENLPQISAIFHNDCMYIAHVLMTLGFEYKNRLPQSIQAQGSTFVDMIPAIRQRGCDHFQKQMSKQKIMFQDQLSQMQSFANIPEHYLDTEKTVKQVLHQLGRLGTVWHDVLPPTIFKKALGSLLSDVIIYIVSGIVSLVDISTVCATQLHSLLAVLDTTSPTIFQATDDEHLIQLTAEMQIFVPNWLKLKELMLVLIAGLQEIVDRWTEGVGPLTMAFSSGEVKNMIRALFQNTERRAQALSKIRPAPSDGP